MWQRVADLSHTAHGSDDQMTMNARTNLAWIWTCLKKSQEAHDLAKAVLERQLQVLGPEHADTMITEDTLAKALEQLGELKEARELRSKTVARAEALLTGAVGVIS